MTILELLIYILFGFIVGFVAKIVLGYTWRMGFIFLTIAGIVGIFLGHFLFLRVLKLYIGRWSYLSLGSVTINWFWAVITSLIIILILHNITGRKLRG